MKPQEFNFNNENAQRLYQALQQSGCIQSSNTVNNEPAGDDDPDDPIIVKPPVK